MDSLLPEEVSYIKQFNSELKDSAYKFIFDEREFIFAYKLKLDVERGKNKAWFWIGKIGEKLTFKIKNDPDDIRSSRDFPIGKKDGAVALAKFVLNLCEKRYPVGNHTNSVSNEIENKKEDDSVDTQTQPKNERFLFLIAKAIQGRRVYCRSVEESNVINDVLGFVMNEISHDAISRKLFKNKQEFDQFKYYRRCTYNLFGITFSLGNISLTKAEEIYYFFIATKMVDVIRSYEKIFNKEIITDYTGLLVSFKQMIKVGDSNYSKGTGLSSGFSLVPESTLEETIQKYLKFIKL